MKFTLLYSKKDSEKDTIILRYRYRLRGKQNEVKIKTPFSINRFDWDDKNEMWDLSKKTRVPRKPEDKERNYLIDSFNTEFGEFKNKIADYISENPYPAYNEVFDFIYGVKEKEAIKKESEYPILFSEFVDFYIKQKEIFIPGKQKPITKASRDRYIQIKTKVNKFYPRLKITDIDDDFRDGYSVFMSKNKYKPSYIVKELKFIKTFCKFANKKLDINKEVLYWEFRDTETEKYLDPTFSFAELKAIKDLDFVLDSYLDNARDWLLISCYTGQRVSDLLNMSSENIINDEFYIVHQKKGQKDVVIWLMPEVMEILEKRDGEFPRKISAPRYNEYIKEVAKLAEINQIIKGGKQIDNRKKIDFYPKYELVTSHIGRRTFVSLFRHLIGSENVKGMTGHTSENMINLYDKTSALEKAKRIKEAFSGLDFSKK